SFSNLSCDSISKFNEFTRDRLVPSSMPKTRLKVETRKDLIDADMLDDAVNGADGIIIRGKPEREAVAVKGSAGIDSRYEAEREAFAMMLSHLTISHLKKS
ncbi:unnamed protein product, partial [marine sediment metagenome]